MANLLQSPPVPSNLVQAGLADHLVEELILKTLYFRKELVGLELAAHLGLPFGVTEGLLEPMRRQQLIQVLRTSELGSVSAVYALTEAGTRMARQYLESNQYAGKAPVPAEHYEEWVLRQQRKRGWLNLAMLESGLAHMVTTPKLLMRLGPALNSAKSILIYGHPGNGKTMLAESMLNLSEEPVYMPYAIECQGQIIQLFDPHYHKLVEESAVEHELFTQAPTYDQRWCKIRRPFVVSGGELSLDALDLSYSDALKFYTAPLQMKANNGMYLVDDLGRQRASPREVLNRWIVPMEQGVDYLTLQNGSKLRVPFDAFLIFSTNLEPNQLADEAFLRRIQYKMLVRNPDDAEFQSIFRRACESLGFPFDRELVDRFIARHYRSLARPMRRCHPRDLLGHAINLIEFHGLAFQLTDEILDEAFESCFLEEES